METFRYKRRTAFGISGYDSAVIHVQPPVRKPPLRRHDFYHREESSGCIMQTFHDCAGYGFVLRIFSLRLCRNFFNHIFAAFCCCSDISTLKTAHIFVPDYLPD